MALDVFIISPIFSIGKSDGRGVGGALKSLRYPISSAEFAVDLLLGSKIKLVRISVDYLEPPIQNSVVEVSEDEQRKAELT